MKVLYLGNPNPNSTSRHRADALTRLGHLVDVAEPAASISKLNQILAPIHFRTGYRLFQGSVKNWLSLLQIDDKRFDVIWIDSGEYFGPKCLKRLRTFGVPLVLYNLDDPTGGSDGKRFDSLLRALQYYDLCAVKHRPEAIQEYLNYGARKLVLFRMSYDEIAHMPYDNPEEIPPDLRSEIAFLGTWMRGEKRDAFLADIVKSGLPLSIWGDRWHKSPYWNVLGPHYKGGALYGRNYVAAIQGAKICIGLTAKKNRDFHTQRSVEIPFSGGLLCAERTTEHLQMYREGEEAVFWNNVEECIGICRTLLDNTVKRKEIRLAGMRRVRQLKAGNEYLCRQVIDSIQHPVPEQVSIIQYPLYRPEPC